MTPRRHAKPKPQRVCVLCGGPIPEQKPTFLVGQADGEIRGPYHSGCAYRLVEAHKGKREMPGPNASQLLGTWPSRREEKTPW